MKRPGCTAGLLGGVLLPALLVVGGGCAPPRIPDKTGPEALIGPLTATFSVPDHPERDFLLYLPPQADGRTDMPVIFGFHGGGGRKEGFIRTGCLDGNVRHRDCLDALAAEQGFVLVMPDGVEGRVGRSWNAGGGEDGVRCVGGTACLENSDDVGYVDDVLAEVLRGVRVDEERVFATGMSNGAALAHRLACERSEVFAAIAPVAGANQAIAAPGCEPARPVPVLQIHGTADTCWGFDGQVTESVCEDSGGDPFMDVPTTMDFWSEHNGCTGVTERRLPDSTDDQTTTDVVEHTGCAATTTLMRINGGGHTWPDGWQYLSARRIGPTVRDWNGNSAVLDFFQQHTLSVSTPEE